MEYDLVFEGGGAKGTVFVGALASFEAHGNVHGRLLGTSAGAITAAFAAAGYASAEMQAALQEKKGGHAVFADFLSEPLPFDNKEISKGTTSTFLHSLNLHSALGAVEGSVEDGLLRLIANNPSSHHLFSFIERGGWYSAHNFLAWLAIKLDAGTFNGQPRKFSPMTLAQFHAATQKDLSLVAADTTGELMLVLNHRTAPDLPLVWAVRMSMSVPLLWDEVVWRPEWGTYRGMKMDGHTIVDGGLLSNFPIELFISDLATVTAVMGPKMHDNVMGLLIDDDVPVPNAPPLPGAQQTGLDLSILPPIRRLTNLVNTMLEARDKSVIAAFNSLVVHLPAKGYGLTEFDMTDARRAALVKAGHDTMEAYLNTRAQTVMAARGAPTAVSSLDIANQTARNILK